ncbi:MAG TPA: RecX family transcriptional regulator [Candidatus Saccharimonadales bacterium]
MKITKIAKMGKEDKFAVFIDDKLNLIISGESLLSSGINVGQKLTDNDLKSIDNLTKTNDLYSRTLKYISLRIKSEGEVKQYLKRKSASDDQIKTIISRLKRLDLINDEMFVRAYIHDRMLQSPSSKRKITFELRKKQIAESVIEQSLKNDQISDIDSLNKLIESKRRQSKYADDLKLMQYLVRVGFNYSDVKEAIKNSKKVDQED